MTDQVGDTTSPESDVGQPSRQETVLTERWGLLIALNRPDVMNAINGALSHGLVDAIATLDKERVGLFAAGGGLERLLSREIGRASCRERV